MICCIFFLEKCFIFFTPEQMPQRYTHGQENICWQDITMRDSIFIPERSIIFSQESNTFCSRNTSNVNTPRYFLKRSKGIFDEVDFIIPGKTLDPVIISQFLFLSSRNKKKLSRKECILWLKNRKRKSITCAFPLQTIFSGRPHTYSPEEALCL